MTLASSKSRRKSREQAEQAKVDAELDALSALGGDAS
jgi:hypothetical protein